MKKKVLELIYSWTVALPDEAKISDAYQMLKKQGKLALPSKPAPGNVSVPGDSRHRELLLLSLPVRYH